MFQKLTASRTPIDLHDDGLRVIKRGTIGNKFPFVSQMNPTLVSAVIGERTRRSIVSETNRRQFT